MFFLFVLQINRSSPQKVHLKSARWSTAGKFRCEVTADDFETASKSGDATVVGKLLANLPYQIAQRSEGPLKSFFILLKFSIFWSFSKTLGIKKYI
jgi:hypothetical protein